jgi:uncharacterized protein involved in exopolysaccharide biosynthesis
VEPERGSVIDTREILWKTKRHRWVALLPLVLILCLAVLYLRVATPVYESSLEISLEDQAQLSEGVERMVRPSERTEDMVQRVARVRNRILNRTFLQGVADRLGFSRDPRLLAMGNAAARKYPGITPDEYASRIAVAGLLKKITVTPGGSSYIKISVKEPNPENARRVATAVGEGLVEDTRKTTLEQAQARGEFSQDQISVATEDLRRAEDALRGYRERTGVSENAMPMTSADPGQADAARDLATVADREMDEIRDRIRSDHDMWTSTVGSGKPLPELRTPATTRLESRLSSLESSYGASSARGGREGTSLLGQISAARQNLLSEYEAAAERLGDVPDDARQIAAGIALDRSVLRSLQARKGRLQGMASSYSSSTHSLPREQMDVERLRNDVQTKRDLLATLQKEAVSSRMSEALETSQLSGRVLIVEPPQLPLKPVWPDPVKIFLGAWVVGLFLSIGVVLGADRVGAVLRTVEQAEEELGAKVIGTIPRIEGWSRPGSFIQNHWPAVSIAVLVVLTVLVTGVYTTVTTLHHGSPTTGETRR